MGVFRINEEATKARQDALKLAQEQLAAGAGQALAQWTTLEFMLTWIFVATMDRSKKSPSQGLTPYDDETPLRIQAHTIMSAIISFEVRMDVVSAVIAETDVSPFLKRLWPGIAARLRKLYKSRHEVAHFMFDQLGQADGSLVVKLAPFPKTIIAPDTKRLDRSHIDHKIERFREMEEAMRWFHEAIEIQRRRLKGRREPAPALIQRVRQSLKTQTPKG